LFGEGGGALWLASGTGYVKEVREGWLLMFVFVFEILLKSPETWVKWVMLEQCLGA
jgi:hypothetical protein